MLREEFDARMAEGLCQADDGEVSSVDDVRKRIMGGTVTTIPKLPRSEIGFSRIGVKNYYIYFSVYEDRNEFSIFDHTL